ncbi:histidine phosphatase family protein [Nocardia nova]|uniref:histidine phosphatase family protein n=1 Tax=Nocardia nova TaxID=37330 RepID=UPI0037AC31D1
MALAAAVLTACTASSQDAATHSTTARADDDHVITITFVRHGESAGNASGLIDTSTPGPDLTDLGRAQARAAATTFADQGVDGVFASTMNRTQETAEYIARSVHKPVRVLAGLREIEAGQYEHQPEATAQSTYFRAPIAWLDGRRSERIPGSIDGNEFDRRFDEAIQDIYDSGDRHPIAVAHGGSIMIWTLMNVKNPQSDLLKTHPLGNTGHISVSGNPRDGWELLDWDGVAVPH